MTPRLVSARFLYLPLRLEVGPFTFAVEALIDTGFDGAILIPPALLASQPPDGESTRELADGSVVSAPTYNGAVHLSGIGSFLVAVTALGAEPLVGRRIIDQVRLTLEHGRAVIVEP